MRNGFSEVERTPDLTELDDLLRAERAADGVRLGIIVLDGDETAQYLAGGLLEAVGLEPARRLARLRPRLTEAKVRPDDVIDFIDHYGHEYTAAVLPLDVDFSDGDREAVEAICHREGCRLIWIAADG